MTIGTPATAEAVHEIDRAHIRRGRPAGGGDHPVARVDRDGHAVGEAIDEPADELRILDRRGADDDARRARLGERLGRIEVADAAARLDLHREATRDLADRIEVRGRPGARAVDVDDVQPLRALVHQALGGLER